VDDFLSIQNYARIIASYILWITAALKIRNSHADLKKTVDMAKFLRWKQLVGLMTVFIYIQSGASNSCPVCLNQIIVIR
jgi:hypothetical protein